MARKYFGSEDPLGKRLTALGETLENCEVTGVFKGLSGQFPSHPQPPVCPILPWVKNAGRGDSSNATETAWGWYDFYVYVQLKPGADWQSLQAKLPAFCDRHINNNDWVRKITTITNYTSSPCLISTSTPI
jgi:putative ABC transport system permease protein